MERIKKLLGRDEEKEEDKLEKFMINLTKKAEKIADRAKKELEK